MRKFNKSLPVYIAPVGPVSWPTGALNECKVRCHSFRIFPGGHCQFLNDKYCISMTLLDCVGGFHLHACVLVHVRTYACVASYDTYDVTYDVVSACTRSGHRCMGSGLE